MKTDIQDKKPLTVTKTPLYNVSQSVLRTNTFFDVPL